MSFKELADVLYTYKGKAKLSFGSPLVVVADEAYKVGLLHRHAKSSGVVYSTTVLYDMIFNKDLKYLKVLRNYWEDFFNLAMLFLNKKAWGLDYIYKELPNTSLIRINSLLDGMSAIGLIYAEYPPRGTVYTVTDFGKTIFPVIILGEETE